MKFLFSLVVMLGVVGCTPPSEPEKIQQEYACRNEGGIHQYNGKFLGAKSLVIQCYSGAKRHWDKEIATKEFVEEFKQRQKLEKELAK